MEHLVALVGFSFVSSVTPGPNNVLLWASGAEFGVRRTIRHILGTALGIGAMALVVAAALGLVVTTLPAIATVMKVAGSVYLLVLAYRIARAGPLQHRDVARPLGLVGAAAFQAVNPKAWIFAIGAITTFRPDDLPVVTGSILVALTMTIVVVPTAAVWAAGGGLLAPFIATERRHRIASLCLAALLAATVAYVWV